MSTPSAPEYAPAQPQYQPQAPNKKFNWKLAATIFAAVLIGGVVGSALKPAPDPVIQVQEKIVEKEVTPDACLKALDLKQEAYDGLFDALKSSLNTDYTAATQSIKDVKSLLPKADAAESGCRSK